MTPGVFDMLIRLKAHLSHLLMSRTFVWQEISDWARVNHKAWRRQAFIWQDTHFVWGPPSKRLALSLVGFDFGLLFVSTHEVWLPFGLPFVTLQWHLMWRKLKCLKLESLCYGFVCLFVEFCFYEMKIRKLGFPGKLSAFEVLRVFFVVVV